MRAVLRRRRGGKDKQQRRKRRGRAPLQRFSPEHLPVLSQQETAMFPAHERVVPPENVNPLLKLPTTDRSPLPRETVPEGSSLPMKLRNLNVYRGVLKGRRACRVQAAGALSGTARNLAASIARTADSTLSTAGRRYAHFASSRGG